MKELSQKRLDAIEDLAIDGLAQIRSFFAYEGKNNAPMQKAKIAVVVLGTYARLRGTETNRMALEASMVNVPKPEPKQIAAS